MVMAQNLLDDNFSKSGNNVVTSNEGEHLNKCNQCQYASSVKSSLRRHLKMHSGEKPNKCNQCDFASSQKSQLNTHLKTHSGEKPNKCNQCDYASSQEGNLRKHFKIVERRFEETFEIAQC